jgi:N-methylhydantoinase A/oxoprolinase/acetone carboxylase beta subunit
VDDHVSRGHQHRLDRAARLALSIDVGGTFTDVAAFDLNKPGPPLVHKRPTEADNPAHGVVAALRELLGEVPRSQVDRVIHATTLPTNTLLERRGARTALVTTAGFRDVLEIGTEQMHSIYDLFATRPAPLVPRSLRRELPERLSRDGDVLEQLDERAAAALVDEFAQAGVEAVAVCFIHAYRNPVHERRFEEIVAGREPDLACSVSSRVAPVIGEYDRTSTVCIDAYVKPLVERYVAELVRGLEAVGVRAPLEFVSSAGTVLSAAAATAVPARLLESGPAAGAFAAAWFGGLAGHGDALSLDIGGTTAKACVVEGGRPEVTNVFEVDRAKRLTAGSGLPLATPSVDLIEIGAGGGSIACVDALGLLKVGPESAGSDPGPACYGWGGSQPTATDADLVLGMIDPGRFLGGRMTLDRERAAAAIESHLARPLGLSVVEAAWGVRAVLDEGMTRAARTHLLERHRDPRDVALIAIGGAGPGHAAGVASAIGIETVIVPLHAGVASAVGALASPFAVAVARSHPCAVATCSRTTVANIYRDLVDEAGALLPGARKDGEFSAAVDARFAGQFHELRIELDWPPAVEWPEQVEERFRARYSERYGRVVDGLAVEVLNWHARCDLERVPARLLPEPKSGAGAEAAAIVDERVAFMGLPAEGPTRTLVYDRYRLRHGARLRGPCIIVEHETNVVVLPSWGAEVDAYRNLILRLERSA